MTRRHPAVNCLRKRMNIGQFVGVKLSAILNLPNLKFKFLQLYTIKYIITYV